MEKVQEVIKMSILTLVAAGCVIMGFYFAAVYIFPEQVVNMVINIIFKILNINI